MPVVGGSPAILRNQMRISERIEMEEATKHSSDPIDLAQRSRDSLVARLAAATAEQPAAAPEQPEAATPARANNGVELELPPRAEEEVSSILQRQLDQYFGLVEKHRAANDSLAGLVTEMENLLQWFQQAHTESREGCTEFKLTDDFQEPVKAMLVGLQQKLDHQEVQHLKQKHDSKSASNDAKERIQLEASNSLLSRTVEALRGSNVRSQTVAELEKKIEGLLEENSKLQQVVDFEAKAWTGCSDAWAKALEIVRAAAQARVELWVTEQRNEAIASQVLEAQDAQALVVEKMIADCEVRHQQDTLQLEKKHGEVVAEVESRLEQEVAKSTALSEELEEARQAHAAMLQGAKTKHEAKLQEALAQQEAKHRMAMSRSQRLHLQELQRVMSKSYRGGLGIIQAIFELRDRGETYRALISWSKAWKWDTKMSLQATHDAVRKKENFATGMRIVKLAISEMLSEEAGIQLKLLFRWKHAEKMAKSVQLQEKIRKETEARERVIELRLVAAEKNYAIKKIKAAQYKLFQSSVSSAIYRWHLKVVAYKDDIIKKRRMADRKMIAELKSTSKKKK